MVIIRNIPARDQLPGQKDYSHLLIATATARSELDNEHSVGNLINPAENVSWRPAWGGGVIEQWVSIFLPSPRSYDVRRLDIQWDPQLPRTGTFGLELYDDQTKTLTLDRKTTNGSLFSVIEIEAENSICDHIKIILQGDLNAGIATIAVYGYELV